MLEHTAWIAVLVVSSAIFASAVVAKEQAKTVTFVPVGDSYSIGEGSDPSEAWPAVMAVLMKSDQLSVDILTNPSRTGFTTSDALQFEMPVVRRLQPEYASLMIGVNDWVQGVSEERFRQQLGMLMDELLLILPEKDHLTVINIPDFSIMPMASMFATGRDVKAGLMRFNVIIAEEAARRELEVIDVFTMTSELNDPNKHFAPDMIHPSAAVYRAWAERFKPVFLKAFQKKTPLNQP